MDTLEITVQCFIDEVEREIRCRSRGKGGQQVPNFGDFANMPPSSLNRLKWWSNEMKAHLANKKEETNG